MVFNQNSRRFVSIKHSRCENLKTYINTVLIRPECLPKTVNAPNLDTYVKSFSMFLSL
jgi:hypothetical protein